MPAKKLPRRDPGERAAFLAGFWTYAASYDPDLLEGIVLDPVPDTFPVQQPKLFSQYPPALAIAGALAVVSYHQDRPIDGCILISEFLQYVDRGHWSFLGYESERDLNRIRLNILDAEYHFRASFELFTELKRRLLAGEELDAEKVRAINYQVQYQTTEGTLQYFKPAHEWMMERKRQYAEATSDSHTSDSTAS